MKTVEMLEDLLGHQISYSSIAPSILHAFEIRDFTVYSNEAEAEPLLQIEKLRLSFNLFKFRPQTPLNAFRGLLIVNSNVHIDNSRNEELLNLLRGRGDAPESSASAGLRFNLPADFFIKGRNIDIRLKTEQYQAGLSKMFFTVTRSPEKEFIISLRAEAETSLISRENLPLEGFELSTAVVVSGRIDSAFDWAELNIRTRNLSSDLLSIDRIGFNLKYDTGLISIVKTGDNIPADISIDYDFDLKRFGLELKAQDFIFNRHFNTGKMLSDYSTFFDCIISGEAELAYFADGGIKYSGDLSVRNLRGLIEGAVDADLQLNGSDKLITVDYSRISADPGTAIYSGTVLFREGLPLVNGRLEVPELSIQDLQLRTSVDITSAEDGGYRLHSTETLVNGLFLPALDAELIPYENNIEFRLNAGIQTSVNSELPTDNIYTEGIIQIGDGYYIQASAEINRLLIDPVVTALPGDFILPPFLSGFELETELFVSGTLEQLSFASPLINLRDRGSDSRSLSFSLSGNNSGIRLTDLLLNWDDYYLKGKFLTDLNDLDNIAVQANLDFNGTAFNSAGVFSTDGSLSLIGDYGLKFNLFTPADLLSFNLKTDRLPLKTKDNESFLSISAAGYYGGSDNWRILLNNVSLDGIASGRGEAELGLSAFLDQNGGNIYSLVYADEQSSLSGSGSILLDRLLPVPEGLVHLNLSSAGGEERYSLYVDHTANRLQGDIRLENFPLRRISGESPVEGTADGRIELAGSPESPELRITAGSQNAAFNNQQVDFDASLLYSGLNLKIDKLNIAYGSYLINDVDGAFDLMTGRHTLEGSLSSESTLLSIASNISLTAETETVDSIMKLPAVVEQDISAEAVLSSLSLNNESREDWRFNLRKQENLVNIVGGLENEIELNFFEDGYFTASAGAPFPAELAVSGILADGNIDASINKLNYVFDELQIPYFTFYSGELKGKLKIQGPLNDPDYFGQLDFHDFVFKPPIVEDITEPFNTSFFFSGREIKLPATRVRTNNGLVYVNLNARLERWLPREYKINLNVPEGEAVSALFYSSPFFVTGFAEGNMKIYGDLSHLRADGTILASEATFMLNNSLDIPSIGSPTEYISSELNVVVKENNQFFWPNRDLPIVKGFLSSGSELKMQYSPDGLVLDGELVLRGGEIFYFERNFYIREGDITFNRATMESMDPLLSVEAEIRDVNTSGELTTIYLIVDRSPLSSFTPRFVSDPPMSTAEILAMIGGNIFDTFDSENSNIADALLLTTDVLAQFAIMRNIEDGLKSTLGLDLLSIRSSFFSNFIENTLLPGTNTDDTTNFASYLDNTTLFLGKYFSDDIFLQGMFQFDLYNDSGYSEEINMNIDSEIKLEWQAPIANIELNFYPDFKDPIEGINKTSLGLSWRFSY